MNNLYKLAVVLNGPPGSGKDTLAKEIVKYGFDHQTMKEALYELTSETFHMPIEIFKSLATDRLIKDCKHHSLAIGTRIFSPREALIYTSEDLIKPRCGKDFFGRKALEKCIEDESHYVVFSDGGFPEEITPLTEFYERVILLHLYRDGCSFDTDSRNYIEGYEHTARIDIIENDIDATMEKIFYAMRTLGITPVAKESHG